MVEIYKAHVTDLQGAHVPDKVHHVDSLLAGKYKGQERKLYELVCDKHNVSVKPESEILSSYEENR